MDFKEGCKLFWVQFPVYFVLGFLLLSGFWLFGDDTKEILKATFFEHFAMKSVVFTFSLCMLVSGLFLVFIGTVDLENQRHSFLYKYIVRPPVDLGITLSSIAFALSSSLFLVLLIEGSYQLLPQLAFGMFCMLIIASAYWAMARVIVDGKLVQDEKAKRYIGFVLIVGVPALLWMTVPTLATT